MNTNKISPDDPRLTAYALNEMEPHEQAEFAEKLRDDPAASATVEEIRATAQALGTALETEPAPGPVEQFPQPAPRKILRFPQLYYMVSGLAAACFALFFVYWQQRPAPDQKNYVEVSLAKVAPAKADLDATQAGASPSGVVLATPLEIPPASATVTPPAKTGQPAEQANEARAALQLPMAKEEKQAGPAASVPASPAVTQVVVTDSTAALRRLDETDKPIVLSPFVVEASEDSGYTAKDTLAGTRVRTSTGLVDAVTSPTAGPPALVVRGVNNPESYKYRRPVEPMGLVGSNVRALVPPPEFNTEAYARLDENPFQTVAKDPLSTFSIDVDTAAYANVRRFLVQKQRPPPDAVRIEEMVNYFPYRYAPPPAGGAPFAASLEVAAAPWAPAHRLVRIGLKGREVSEAARPAANLVFLIDVSGSMDEPNKLPLVKQSLRMLVGRLRPDDRVAIVVYAGASGLALPSTSAKEKTRILNAIDELRAEGSTNGEAGIHLAYDIAKANFVTGGVNRVILATDGDFNVGTTNEGELTRLVAEKARSGVFLTVLGFGMGNYKDAMLVKLSDKGDGNYAYIDSAAEARKALVEQAGGTLVTIAKDVKIQVEFNPALVQAYRLIGYEKRMLRAEDFNDDKVDAGEIGAGHTVTALYEIVPVGADAPATGSVDPLKYQKTRDAGLATAANSDELLTLKVRYKEPAGNVSSKVEFPLRDSGHRFAEASADFKFSSAVAAFGMILRESPHKGDATLANVASWARSGLEEDAGGYRAEFLELVSLAAEVAP